MFRDMRRKRLRARIIFAALGVLILVFGIWLNYQGMNENGGTEDAVKKVEVKETKAADEKSEKDAKTAKAAELRNQGGTGTQMQPETYLIKEVDGVVKVFICDKAGNEELYLITSIPFDLLSESDQQLFVDGVRMETEDDLGKFLENFDS